MAAVASLAEWVTYLSILYISIFITECNRRRYLMCLLEMNTEPLIHLNFVSSVPMYLTSNEKHCFHHIIIVREVEHDE